MRRRKQPHNIKSLQKTPFTTSLLFSSAKVEIEKNLTVHPQRGRRALTKDDFQNAKALFLPEKAPWEYLATLPESQDIGEELGEAMRAIGFAMCIMVWELQSHAK